MRKLLFVHDEWYLDLSVRNVQELLAFEQRSTDGNSVSDLLAVLLMSADKLTELLLREQEWDTSSATDRNLLFGPDSVSVNGVWTLVTLVHEGCREPVTRQDALDRVLELLEKYGFARNSDKVFRVSTIGEPYCSIGEPMAFLKIEQLSN